MQWKWTGLVTLTLLLGNGGCFDADKYKGMLPKPFPCKTDADCIDGYKCSPTSRTCAPEAPDIDCKEVYFTATNLELTIHFKDQTQVRVPISAEGLDPNGMQTTEPGQYSAQYLNREEAVTVVVENAKTIIKASFSSCPLICIGERNNDYNPTSCIDNDCDGYGEGMGCKGLDGNDENNKVYPDAPEICDGVDNDGDLLIDDQDDQGPTVYVKQLCPKQAGVCKDKYVPCVNGRPNFCDENTYGPDYADIETRDYCDWLDNDCDARTDEECTCREGDKKACGIPDGECEMGFLYCKNGTFDESECVGEVGPAPEVCDCKDNDCDRKVDMRNGDGLNVCGQACPTCETLFLETELDGRQVTVCIDRYEASRRNDPENPDSLRHRSVPGELPWLNVSFAHANQACSNAGKELCPISVWEKACRSIGAGGDMDRYPYGVDYRQEACNGNNINPGPVLTGSMEECISQWEARGNGPPEIGRLFDMSGNVAEWVAPPTGQPGERWIMGGAFDSARDALTCRTKQERKTPNGEWDGSAAPNIGFRCCKITR